MDSETLREWQTAAIVDPFPTERIEFMLARVCALIHNAWSGEDTGSKKPKNFIPDYHLSPEERQQKKAERQKKKMEVIKLKRELTKDDG